MAQITSGATTDLLTIDPVSKAARATLYDATGQASVQANGAANVAGSGLVIHGINDENQRAMRVDRMGNASSAVYNLMVNESFMGSALSTTRWNVVGVTMTAVQASLTGITLNSGAITTASSGYLLRSQRPILKSQKSPGFARFRSKLTPVNNAQVFLGYTDAASATALGTNYIGWEVTAAGLVRPTWFFNGSQVAVGTDIRSLLNFTNNYVFDVWLDDDDAYFYIQDTATGLIISSQTLNLPLSVARFFALSHVFVGAQLFNTASAPATAPSLQITEITVGQLEMGVNTKPWNHQCAGNDHNTIVDPFAGTQLSNFTNSTAPTSASLSNTAAGYTTLGGNFQFAAVAGAVTDYALFAYAVPAGRSLYVDQITIDVYNTGVAVATTPTVFQWFAGPNAAAATLASGSFRRHLGIQSLPVAAAVGAQAQTLNLNFPTPMFTPGGRTFHIGLRMPVGTATATEVFVGAVGVGGYMD